MRFTKTTKPGLLSTLGPFALPAGAWIAGLLAIFWQVVMSGLELTFAGLDDPRLVNFILEHGYRWLLGYPAHADFWSPPVYYPHTNISAYSDVLIGGFVISGEASVQLLIRGVGPGLIDFGLVDVVENPRITVHDEDGTPLVSNSGWGLDGRMAEIENRSAQVGAFPLERGAKDAAIIVTLAPGVYTCVLDSTDVDTGVGLLELYVVP